MAAMKRRGNAPVGLWAVIDELVRAEHLTLRGDVRQCRQTNMARSPTHVSNKLPNRGVKIGLRSAVILAIIES